MSTEMQGELADRMAVLLKHARLRLAEFTVPALKPYGINGKELAVLTVLAGGETLSQQEAAQRLAVDRTTMVALVDALEAKGLVVRHPHPEDRRKNVVELTPRGHEVHAAGDQAGREAEARFLMPIGAAEAERLRRALRTLADLTAAPPAASSGDAAVTR